jgi:hypothetical protein
MSVWRAGELAQVVEYLLINTLNFNSTLSYNQSTMQRHQKLRRSEYEYQKKVKTLTKADMEAGS